MYLGRAIISIFIFSILFLSGCSLSFEDASKETLKAVEESLSEEKKEANEASDQFSYYLPPEYEVDSAATNNIVLTHKEQTYILFINPFEPDDSKVIYESTLEGYESPEVEETFSKDGEFGYVIIDRLEKEEFYEITVGVGGVKMTTVTDPDNMEKSADTMMEIVSSVEVQGEES
ncbi:hypothetical protein LC085_08340 [Bacillus tianshenii]|uniref:hypothetical protein n=1 Tax=Sutcliffiella tianshenii TaxID=1463404 RepID=UPI001CD62A92|nr:hypothetical protein [Bacillus tianshenii]MCA1319922.1 hypothetical protein [Bacillus tianshenii]